MSEDQNDNLSHASIPAWEQISEAYSLDSGTMPSNLILHGGRIEENYVDAFAHHILRQRGQTLSPQTRLWFNVDRPGLVPLRVDITGKDYGIESMQRIRVIVSAREIVVENGSDRLYSSMESNPIWRQIKSQFDKNHLNPEPFVRFHGTSEDKNDPVWVFARDLAAANDEPFNEENKGRSFTIKVDGIAPLLITLFHASIMDNKQTCVHVQQLASKDSPLSSWERMVKDRVLSQEMADFLVNVMRQGADIYVDGTTGSGKTTFLRSLLAATYGGSEAQVTIVEEWRGLSTDELRCIRNASVLIPSSVDNLNSLLRVVVGGSGMPTPERLAVGEVHTVNALDSILGRVPLATTVHGMDNGGLEHLQRLLGTKQVPDNSVLVHVKEDNNGMMFVSAISQIAPSDTALDRIVRPLFRCSDVHLRAFVAVDRGTRSFRRAFGLDGNAVAGAPTAMGKAQEMFSDLAVLAQITPSDAQEMLDALDTLQKFFRRFV